MGEFSSFHEYEGVVNADFVKQLAGLDLPPDDPTLLARLIDKFAGTDLDFHAAGLDARCREARREALKHLRSIQKHTRSLMALDTDPNFNLLGLALADLVAFSAINVDGKLPGRLEGAIHLLELLPVPRTRG